MSRNIVLVTIDSLRADHCGFMGHGRHTTPTLDSMAENGIAFTDAVAPGPKTPESMPVIFTGSFPLRWNSETSVGSWRKHIRPHMDARETIPERLSRLGYTTGGFSPNGFTTEYFGFGQGFDVFEDFTGQDLRPGMDVPNVLRGVIKWLRNEGNWKTWENYYDSIVQFTEQATEPYFLWIFLLDVHSPYLVPRAYRTENSWYEMMKANWKYSEASESDTVHEILRSAYEDTIQYTDAFLERLQDDLAADDPILAVHADHGEAFGEHGIYGHERYLYRENIHVPFVLSNTDLSTEVKETVSLAVLPDLLEQLARNGEGKMLEWLSSQYTGSPVVVRSHEGGNIGVKQGRFKLIDQGDDTVLYDLEKDPSERIDQSERYPSIVQALKRRSCRHTESQHELRTVEEESDEVVRKYQQNL